jgi:hypothetical protein
MAKLTFNFALFCFIVFSFIFLITPTTANAKRLPVYQGSTALFSQPGGESWPYFATYDSEGNLYTGGWFAGTTDLCPGSQESNYTATSSDGYITKILPNGDCAWARVYAGAGGQTAEGIVFDSSKNMYIISDFQNSTDIDLTSGVDNRTSAGSDDIVISKYLADGTYAWSKVMGGTGSDYPVDIEIDSQNNIYIVGTFRSTVDFDPGTGVDNRVSNGGADVFITKFTQDGDRVWTRTFGGTSSDWHLSMDLSSNMSDLFLTGYFYNSVDFDFTSGTDVKTSNGNEDGYFMKISTDGNYGWTKTLGGTEWDYIEGVVLDSERNIYINGDFRLTADFDTGVGTDNRTSNGRNDVFISKYSPNGDYIWTKTFGGVSNDYPEAAFTIVHNDKLVVTGKFNDTVDFDPGSGVATRSEATSVGNYDGSAYTAIYNKDGGFEWVHTANGGVFSWGREVAIYGDKMSVIGLSTGTVDLDPYGSHDYVTTDPTWGDMFISTFTFSQDTTEYGQTPRSQEPNVRPDFVKSITAGPNRVGTPNWVVSSESDNVAKAYLTNDVYKDDVHLDIASSTQNDLQNTKPKRIPFPWEQGLNTASDIYWKFDISSAFNGYPIPKLTKSGTLILTYDPTKLYGKPPTTLKIAYFNPTINRWTTLTTKPTLDTTNHTISTQFTFPGYYVVVYNR